MSDHVIWKFELHPQIVPHLPRGAKVLSAGAQGDSIVVWALCDPDAPKVERNLIGWLTGGPLPAVASRIRFVGTVQMDNGLVFHVFDGGEAA